MGVWSGSDPEAPGPQFFRGYIPPGGGLGAGLGDFGERDRVNQQLHGVLEREALAPVHVPGVVLPELRHAEWLLQAPRRRRCRQGRS